MSLPHTPSPLPDPQNTTAEVLCLKRRITALQSDVERANGIHAKKAPTAVTIGRGIRRLVSLFEPVDAIIAEADYRVQVESDGSQVPVPYTDDQMEAKLAADRTYRGYTLLLHLVPSLKTLLEDPEADNDDLDKFIASLQKGGNDARSDDVRRVKEELGSWLNADYLPSSPFNVKSRADRGLQNDITGRLLCPIEQKWDDEQVRSNIRAGLLDISDDYFLTCFYPKGQGDPDNVERHFLRSQLLVKTYCSIFTSPTSTESFDTESEEGPSRKRQHTDGQKKATKSNVATLLHMEGKVTPRSVAYAATILVFNLTDATQWVGVYNGFHLQALYNFIVDYFEGALDPTAEKRTKDLLKWWNKQVFPHVVTTATNSRKSRNKLASQRALNNHD